MVGVCSWHATSKKSSCIPKAGPALTPLNLHYAAATGLIAEGDTVLVYGPGSASAAAAVVLRWGDTRLGPLPENVT